MKVITDAEQVTPEWLTRVLRERGCLSGGEVTSVSVTSREPTFTSKVARLQVIYSADAPADAPSRLFLKISCPESAPGDFEREHLAKEVEFHNTVAQAMADPPSVTCYEAVYRDEQGRAHLLLDDVSETHFQPEQPLPPTVDYCEMAIDCLSRFHAFWWDHPRLGGDFAKSQTQQEREAGFRRQAQVTEEFIAFLGDRLSKERRNVYEGVLAALPELSRPHDRTEKVTLVHGDAHLGNFLFPKDAGKDRPYIIDWQFWHPGVCSTDLAFMMALEWYAERRRRLEVPLLRRYHGRLLERGVEGYDWEDCWHDYRLSVMLVALFVPAWQWSVFKAGPGMWWRDLERAMSAFEGPQLR